MTTAADFRHAIKKAAEHALTVFPDNTEMRARMFAAYLGGCMAHHGETALEPLLDVVSGTGKASAEKG